MPNPEGTPIWYELLTNDAAASTRFYEEVVGWKVHPAQPGAAMDYRMIDTGQGFVGGLMPLNDQMRTNGARPTWLFYIGVDDVDATVKKAETAGASVLMKPFDLPDVGRIAMIADPQGVPLYVMRGTSSENSTVFDRHALRKCSWNELYTPDQAAANTFYSRVFGWTYPDKMAIPGAGDYVMAAVRDTIIGATMTQPAGAPRGWQFYFRIADIEAAAARVKKAGGTVHAGPMDVPGGDRVIVASDTEGVPFGLVASAKSAT